MLRPNHCFGRTSLKLFSKSRRTFFTRLVSNLVSRQLPQHEAKAHKIQPQEDLNSTSNSHNPKIVADIPVNGMKPTSAELTIIRAHWDSHSSALSLQTGRFSKTSLCATHGILGRDLRRLDGIHNKLPVILVRDSVLLVALDYLRAIIKHDALLLLESTDMQERVNQHSFLIDLKLRMDQPFEFQILEAMLQRVLADRQEELDKVVPLVEATLASLEKHVHWDKLLSLLNCKRRVQALEERVDALRDCIRELLESDADMSNMYLTDKALYTNNDYDGDFIIRRRPETAHEEVELLLESYLQTAEELARHAHLLSSNISSTEDIVNIGLIGQRNDLLLLELKLGIGTFAASMGGLGTSALGMNLVNGFEGIPGTFFVVIGFLTAVSASAFAVTWRMMLRVLRRSAASHCK